MAGGRACDAATPVCGINTHPMITIIRIIFYGSDCSFKVRVICLALPFLRGLLRFLRLGLEGPVLVETFLDCHKDVISDLHRGFSHFEGGSFSSAEGHLPSFERTLNLLSRGKAFLDMELPREPDPVCNECECLQSFMLQLPCCMLIGL